MFTGLEEGEERRAWPKFTLAISLDRSRVSIWWLCLGAPDRCAERSPLVTKRAYAAVSGLSKWLTPKTRFWRSACSITRSSTVRKSRSIVDLWAERWEMGRNIRRDARRPRLAIEYL